MFQYVDLHCQVAGPIFTSADTPDSYTVFSFVYRIHFRVGWEDVGHWWICHVLNIHKSRLKHICCHNVSVPFIFCVLHYASSTLRGRGVESAIYTLWTLGHVARLGIIVYCNFCCTFGSCWIYSAAWLISVLLAFLFGFSDPVIASTVPRAVRFSAFCLPICMCPSQFIGAAAFICLSSDLKQLWHGTSAGEELERQQNCLPVRTSLDQVMQGLQEVWNPYH